MTALRPTLEAEEAAAVSLRDGKVFIREFYAAGELATVVQAAVESGQDAEGVVRSALEIGAAVLAHGTAKGTVDAVAAEVDRLLNALNERSARLESLRVARQRMSARGFDFESELGAKLGGYFASNEDELEATGSSRGIGAAKVGDYVLTLNPKSTAGAIRRIVFEAKDRALPLAKALAEIDAAMLNRDAAIGVMVFAHAEQAPLHGRSLGVFENRIILVWDADAAGDLALEVGATLARRLAAGLGRDDGRLSKRAVASRVDQLVSVIERAAAIKRGLATAQRGLSDTEDAYEEMRSHALGLLWELQDKLA